MRRMGVRQTHRSRSQVINNDLNPKWNEDFKILVHEPEHQVRGAQGMVCCDCHCTYHTLTGQRQVLTLRRYKKS